MPTSKSTSRIATLGEIRALVGDVDEARLEAILALRPTPAQLEEALAWAAGESDVMGDLERPLAGTVAAIYDILTSDEAFEEDRER